MNMVHKNWTTLKWISSPFGYSATASNSQANFKCCRNMVFLYISVSISVLLGRYEIEIILFIVFDFNLFGSLSIERGRDAEEMEENEKKQFWCERNMFFSSFFIALLKRNSIPSDWKSSAHANYNDQRIYGTIVILATPSQCQRSNTIHKIHTSNRTKKSNFHSCMIKCVTVRCCALRVCGRNLHAYVKFLRWKMR